MKLLDKFLGYFRRNEPAVITPGETALLVIDVQKAYCDPKLHRGNDDTVNTSKKIGSLTPAFRKAGIPVYVVYFMDDEPSSPAKIDFFHFAPEKDDVLVRKTEDSAFKGSNIAAVLKAHGRKNLLTCGFNLTACVQRTAVDAVMEGFNVTILRDLCANDNNNYTSKPEVDQEIKYMRKKGIRFANAQSILKILEKSRKSPVAPSANKG